MITNIYVDDSVSIIIFRDQQSGYWFKSSVNYFKNNVFFNCGYFFIKESDLLRINCYIEVEEAINSEPLLSFAEVYDELFCRLIIPNYSKNYEIFKDKIKIFDNNNSYIGSTSNKGYYV